LATSELKYKRLQGAGGTVTDASVLLTETKRQLAVAQQEAHQLREMRGEWSKYVQPPPQEAPPTLLEETQAARVQWEQTVKVWYSPTLMQALAGQTSATLMPRAWC